MADWALRSENFSVGLENTNRLTRTISLHILMPLHPQFIKKKKKASDVFSVV